MYRFLLWLATRIGLFWLLAGALSSCSRNAATIKADLLTHDVQDGLPLEVVRHASQYLGDLVCDHGQIPLPSGYRVTQGMPDCIAGLQFPYKRFRIVVDSADCRGAVDAHDTDGFSFARGVLAGDVNEHCRCPSLVTVVLGSEFLGLAVRDWGSRDFVGYRMISAARTFLSYRAIVLVGVELRIS